jgi:NAD dependent epimerase/dehydratase family enzyme
LATLVVDGQRALPQRLEELGFQFAHKEAETALRALLA